MSSGGHYDDHHTQFVSSETGTSASEILHILVSVSLMPLLASLLIPWVVPPTFSGAVLGDVDLRNLVRAVVEYPVVMILPLFLITVLAGADYDEKEEGFIRHLSFCAPLIILLSCVSILVINQSITRPRWAGFRKEWNRVRYMILPWLKPERDPGTILKVPFITNYRGIVTYVTVLSILAVDFKIFPRRFCKTKTFGFSLMDIGTGSFVFANGIVSSEAKNLRTNLKKTLISTLPLFLLGIVRLVTVKGLEYQEVVEEYGVHWNFFFTLAFVKICSGILFTFVRPTASLSLSIAIGLLYDIFLTQTGIQTEYILNQSISRQANLINANREGVFSTLGYLSIYLGSVYVGQLIYKNVKTRYSVQDWVTYCGQSGSQVLILWLFAYAWHSYVNPCSRRVGNFSYVLWALATNYSVLWLQLTLNLVQVVCQHLGLLHGPIIYHNLHLKETNAGSVALENLLCREKAKRDKLKKQADSEIQTENALNLLEGKVEQIAEKMKSHEASSRELEAITEQVEKELLSLGSKCKDTEEVEPDTENEKEEERRNLLELPDLAGSPISLEAVCYNGLFVFLIGNLLTGLVNSLVYSMYTPSAVALLILWIYASIVTLVSLTLYWYKIQLKFW